MPNLVNWRSKQGTFVFIFWILSLLFALFPTSARADFFACQQLTPDQQLQAEYCETHASCRIAVAIFKGCSEVKDFINRFYDSNKKASSDGTSSGLSEQERIDAMSSIDRDAGYKRCLTANVQDVCWDRYATTEMRSQKVKAGRDAISNRSAASDRLASDRVRSKRSTLEIREASLLRRLMENCSPTTTSSMGCESAVIDVSTHTSQVAAFNADPESIKWTTPLIIQSTGVAKPYSKAMDEKLAKLFTSGQPTTTESGNSPAGQNSTTTGNGDPSISGAQPINTLASMSTAQTTPKPVALRRGATTEVTSLFGDALASQKQLGKEALIAASTSVPRVTAINRQIDSVRGQCMQSQQQCQARCSGAMGASLISGVFGGNMSDLQNLASGTSHMHQCSDSCDQSRRSCDRQVDALIRKRDAVLNPSLARSETMSPNDTASPADFGGGNLSFEECREHANSDPVMEANMRSISRNDNNRLLRGSIVAIGSVIDKLQKCSADPRAQNLISQLEQQKASALQTCRQTASYDNCLVSPF